MALGFAPGGASAMVVISATTSMLYTTMQNLNNGTAHSTQQPRAILAAHRLGCVIDLPYVNDKFGVLNNCPYPYLPNKHPYPYLPNNHPYPYLPNNYPNPYLPNNFPYPYLYPATKQSAHKSNLHFGDPQLK